VLNNNTSTLASFP